MFKIFHQRTRFLTSLLQITAVPSSLCHGTNLSCLRKFRQSAFGLLSKYNLTLASTFIGDGLSTSIISPTDSSATLLSAYHSTCESANLSRELKGGIVWWSKCNRWLTG